MFTVDELEIILNSLDKNTSLYKKVEALIYKEQKSQKNILEIIKDDEKKNIKKLFDEKKEEELIRLLKNKDPNSNLQDRRNLPESYWRNDVLLYYSTICGMEKLTSLLITNGAKTYEYSYELLNALAYSGNVTIAKMIFNKGVDVLCQGDIGQLPLSQAVENDKYEIVKLFLEKGVPVNEIGLQKMSALHRVKNTRMAKLLISYGANLNTQNEYGDTPLVYISRMKHNPLKTQDLIILLLAVGADREIENKWGMKLTDYILTYKQEEGVYTNYKDRIRMLPVYNELLERGIIR